MAMTMTTRTQTAIRNLKLKLAASEKAAHNLRECVTEQSVIIRGLRADLNGDQETIALLRQQLHQAKEVIVKMTDMKQEDERRNKENAEGASTRYFRLDDQYRALERLIIKAIRQH